MKGAKSVIGSMIPKGPGTLSRESKRKPRILHEGVPCASLVPFLELSRLTAPIVEVEMHAWRSVPARTSGRVSLWTLAIAILLIAAFACTIAAAAQSSVGPATGTVLDPAGRPVAGAHVKFDSASGAQFNRYNRKRRRVRDCAATWGAYTVRVEAEGFAPLTLNVDLSAATESMALRLESVAGATEESDRLRRRSEIDLALPIRLSRVMVREELLDAIRGDLVRRYQFPACQLKPRLEASRLRNTLCPVSLGTTASRSLNILRWRLSRSQQSIGQRAWQRLCRPEYLCSGAIEVWARTAAPSTCSKAIKRVEPGSHYSLRPQLRRFVTLTGDERDLD